MSYEVRYGDLFGAELPALAHGCNCAGAMGAGIAKEFRRRWPDMYEEYKVRCQDGSFGLGDVFMWQAPDRVVFNLGTQRTWRTRAEIPAIEESVRRMLELAEEYDIAGIGLPRIGAGLGGLDWSQVAEAIRPLADPSPVEVVVFELQP